MRQYAVDVRERVTDYTRRRLSAALQAQRLVQQSTEPSEADHFHGLPRDSELPLPHVQSAAATVPFPAMPPPPPLPDLQALGVRCRDCGAPAVVSGKWVTSMRERRQRGKTGSGGGGGASAAEITPVPGAKVTLSGSEAVGGAAAASQPAMDGGEGAPEVKLEAPQAGSLPSQTSSSEQGAGATGDGVGATGGGVGAGAETTEKPVTEPRASSAAQAESPELPSAPHEERQLSDDAESGTGAATAAESDGSTAFMSDDGGAGDGGSRGGRSSAAGSVAAQASRAGSVAASRPLVSELCDLLQLTLPRTLDPDAVPPPGLNTGALDFGTDAVEVDPSHSLAKVARRQAIAIATQVQVSSGPSGAQLVAAGPPRSSSSSSAGDGLGLVGSTGAGDRAPSVSARASQSVPLKDLESQGGASVPRSAAGSVRSSKASVDRSSAESGAGRVPPGPVPPSVGERDADTTMGRKSPPRPASPAAATAGTHLSGLRDAEDRDPLEADDDSLWHMINEGLPRCDVPGHGDGWVRSWADRGGAGSWFEGVHGNGASTAQEGLGDLGLDSSSTTGGKMRRHYGLSPIAEAPAAPLRPDPVSARAIFEIRTSNRRRWTGKHGKFSSVSAGFQPVVALGYDSRMLLHDEIPKRRRPLAHGIPVAPRAPHPERSDRLRGIAGHLAASGLWQRCWRVPTREARREECELAHTSQHMDQVESLRAVGDAGAGLTQDTFASKHTLLAARLACGTVLAATEAVCRGHADSGLAVVRPPGHHAEPDVAMGFCLLNNAAVAAAVARRDWGARRVLLLDWDVHHGNGTQAIFENDPDVMYVSVHRHDDGRFYPGTGAAQDIGEGPGIGRTVNVPWPSGGMGDLEYTAAFERLIMPVAREFAPDLVIVSAGFDAAEGDPLGGCAVTPAGYAHMTAMLQQLAGGRIVLALEGGYNVRCIARSTEACLRVLLGGSPPPLPSPEHAKAASLAAAQLGAGKLGIPPGLEDSAHALAVIQRAREQGHDVRLGTAGSGSGSGSDNDEDGEEGKAGTGTGGAAVSGNVQQTAESTENPTSGPGQQSNAASLSNPSAPMQEGDTGAESNGTGAAARDGASSGRSAVGSGGTRDEDDEDRAGGSDSSGGSLRPSDLIALAPGAAQAIEAATQALRPHWQCLGALVAQGEVVAAASFRRSIRQRLQKLAAKYAPPPPQPMPVTGGKPVAILGWGAAGAAVAQSSPGLEGRSAGLAMASPPAGLGGISPGRQPPGYPLQSPTDGIHGMGAHLGDIVDHSRPARRMSTTDSVGGNISQEVGMDVPGVQTGLPLGLSGVVGGRQPQGMPFVPGGGMDGEGVPGAAMPGGRSGSGNLTPRSPWGASESPHHAAGSTASRNTALHEAATHGPPSGSASAAAAVAAAQLQSLSPAMQFHPQGSGAQSPAGVLGSGQLPMETHVAASLPTPTEMAIAGTISSSSGLHTPADPLRSSEGPPSVAATHGYASSAGLTASDLVREGVRELGRGGAHLVGGVAPRGGKAYLPVALPSVPRATMVPLSEVQRIIEAVLGDPEGEGEGEGDGDVSSEAGSLRPAAGDAGVSGAVGGAATPSESMGGGRSFDGEGERQEEADGAEAGQGTAPEGGEVGEGPSQAGLEAGGADGEPGRGRDARLVGVTSDISEELPQVPHEQGSSGSLAGSLPGSPGLRAGATAVAGGRGGGPLVSPVRGGLSPAGLGSKRGRPLTGGSSEGVGSGSDLGGGLVTAGAGGGQPEGAASKKIRVDGERQ